MLKIFVAATLSLSSIAFADSQTIECANSNRQFTFSGSSQNQTPTTKQWMYNGQPVESHMASFDESKRILVETRRQGPYVIETYAIKASASFLNPREGRILSDYLICTKTSSK